MLSEQLLNAKKEKLSLHQSARKRIKFGHEMIAAFDKHVDSGAFEKKIEEELSRQEEMMESLHRTEFMKVKPKESTILSP